MNIRKSFLIVCILPMLGIAAVSAQSEKPRRGTVEYYLAYPEKYVDKTVSLKIFSISPKSVDTASVPIGYELCMAFTTHGQIYVLVPESRKDLILKRYNQKVPEWIKHADGTRTLSQTSKIMPLSGKLVKIGIGLYAVQMP